MNTIRDQLIDEHLIDETAAKQLEAYVDLFQRYNQHTNLSAIRETDDIWQKHIADSLMLLKFEEPRGKAIDIGTGGGLPGIALAIARPELDVLLLDSVAKKVKACEHFAQELRLKNVYALQARAERLGQEKDYQGAYDAVVSRATAYLPTILAWSEQFIRSGGRILLYKTPSADELTDGQAAAKRLSLDLSATHMYELADQERQLLVYAKN